MRWIAAIAVVLGALGCQTGEAPGEPAPPNVLVVFIDDMGYGDLSLTGNPHVETTNIDRIAKEGLLIEQFYVASPICSPSRVGLTTGQYPARHGIHSYLNSRKRNRERGMRNYLDPKTPAVARTFQAAGYRTAHFGKWHMGGGRDVDDAPLPQAYGFDESLVSFEGLGDRILPPGRLSDMSAELGHGEIRRVEKHEQTQIYVDRTVGFVEREDPRPFYVHLWLNDVHDAFKPKPGTEKEWETVTDNPEEQKFFAVLKEMDRQLGRLFEALDAHGLAENTIVVVTGDNGPTAWPRYYNDGIEPPGSTAGMRGRKWSLYEGGIRQPLLVRWPARLESGQVDAESVVGAVDLFPTLCALAGMDAPDVAFDGEDRSGVLLGNAAPRSKPLIWEYGRDETYLRPGLEVDQSPGLAIREGKWKLLMNADGSNVELYDLEASPDESVNLAMAEGNEELVTRLKGELLGFWRELPVVGK